MSDDEQPDDHLSLIAKANGKAPADRHDVTTESGFRATANAPQLIQVETLGKTGLTVMLFMFAAVLIVGMMSAYSLGVGQARAEGTDARVRTLVGKVEVAQYDIDQVRAQLIAKGVIEHTGH